MANDIIDKINAELNKLEYQDKDTGLLPEMFQELEAEIEVLKKQREDLNCPDCCDKVNLIMKLGNKIEELSMPSEADKMLDLIDSLGEDCEMSILRAGGAELKLYKFKNVRNMLKAMICKPLTEKE